MEEGHDWLVMAARVSGMRNCICHPNPPPLEKLISKLSSITVWKWVSPGMVPYLQLILPTWCQFIPWPTVFVSRRPCSAQPELEAGLLTPSSTGLFQLLHFPHVGSSNLCPLLPERERTWFSISMSSFIHSLAGTLHWARTAITEQVRLDDVS